MSVEFLAGLILGVILGGLLWVPITIWYWRKQGWLIWETEKKMIKSLAFYHHKDFPKDNPWLHDPHLRTNRPKCWVCEK